MPKIENIHYDTYDNNLVMKLKLLKLSHKFFFLNKRLVWGICFLTINIKNYTWYNNFSFGFHCKKSLIISKIF